MLIHSCFIFPSFKITSSILNERKRNEIGLDFGCGKDSPIVKVLRQNEYEILEYDPFFFDDKKLLEKKLDLN